MPVLYFISGINWYAQLLRVIRISSILLACNSVSAYDWERVYDVAATVGFDDNFRLRPDDKIDTTSTELSVSGGMERATEISNIRLELGINGTSYSESSIDDDSEYKLSLRSSRSVERFSSFLDVSLKSEATTKTELLDTGFLAEDGTRDSARITPGLSYQVDERNSISASLELKDVSYDTVSLTEYQDNSVSLGWSYRLEETSSVTTSVRHTSYDPDDDDDTDTNSVNLGYELNTSEATTYNFSVGFSEVDRPDDSEDGGIYAFDVNHRTDERNSFTLGLSNSFEPSGRGRVREEDGLNLLWNHGLSERTQVTVSAEAVNTDDRDYYGLRARSRYRYTREIGLSASYRYRERDEGVASADSNTVFFSLSYAPN